jgi:integrase/recombinase XerD
MRVSLAASIWLEHPRSHARENTRKAYQASSGIFLGEFADAQTGEISTEDILSFLNRVTEGKKPQTRRTRYADLAAFFNFIRSNLDPDFRNPCDKEALPE